MSLVGKVDELHRKLTKRKQQAHDQGLDPKVVPLTLEEGTRLTSLLFLLAMKYDHHTHELPDQDVETHPPRV